MAEETPGKSEETPKAEGGTGEGEPKKKTDDKAGEPKLSELETTAEIIAHKGSSADEKATAIETLSGKHADRRVTQAQEKWAGERETLEAEAKSKAEEEGLARNKEYQKLSEKHGARISELEPELEASKAGAESEKARADKAEEVLGEYVTSELEALELDEAVTDLLEGKDPVAKMEWLTKYRDALSKRKPGDRVPRSPNGDNAQSITDEQRRQAGANTWL